MPTTFTKLSDHQIEVKIVSEDAIEKMVLTKPQVEAHLAESQARASIMQEALQACEDLNITHQQEPTAP